MRKMTIPYEFDTPEDLEKNKGRQIDPNSPEGKAIARQILEELPEDWGTKKKSGCFSFFTSLCSERLEKKVSAWGETKTISEWLEDARCRCKSRLVLRKRLNSGWSAERALGKEPNYR